MSEWICRGSREKDQAKKKSDRQNRSTRDKSFKTLRRRPKRVEHLLRVLRCRRPTTKRNWAKETTEASPAASRNRNICKHFDKKKETNKRNQGKIWKKQARRATIKRNRYQSTELVSRVRKGRALSSISSFHDRAGRKPNESPCRTDRISPVLLLPRWPRRR